MGWTTLSLNWLAGFLSINSITPKMIIYQTTILFEMVWKRTTLGSFKEGNFSWDLNFVFTHRCVQKESLLDECQENIVYHFCSSTAAVFLVRKIDRNYNLFSRFFFFLGGFRTLDITGSLFFVMFFSGNKVILYQNSVWENWPLGLIAQ